MKFTKLFPLLLVAFVLFSCAEFPDDEGADSDQKGPPEFDADCLSVSGERLEKYYLEIDSSFLDKKVTLSSPNVLGYEYDDEEGRFHYAFNKITLHDVPLSAIVNKTPYTAKVSGTVALSGNQGPLHAAYSAPFEGSALIYPEHADYGRAPYDILNSFTNTPGNLALPYTGKYSSSHFVDSTLAFSVPVSSSLLGSLNKTESFSIGNANFIVDRAYPADLICLGELNLVLVPKSRGFFQYRSLAASFAPDKTITAIKASPIVESYVYDSQKNVLSVIFRPYDNPYAGTVLSYLISSGGSTVEKTIRIEG